MTYRRKRRLQGASFSTLFTGAELREDGPWCQRCKQRHGYMVCKVAYDFTGKDPKLRWLCPFHGHDIGELILDRKRDDTGPAEDEGRAPGEAEGLRPSEGGAGQGDE